jgi:phosphate:Na+ symporter
MNTIEKILFTLFISILSFFLYLSNDFTLIAMGIAFFILGMFFMEEGFKQFSGGLLKTLLGKMTNTLPKSIFSGFFTTTFVQSSSLVSLITISFLSAELLGLREAIGIILGSNVGSTTTAWIVSSVGFKLKIATYAMPLFIFGVIFSLLKDKTLIGLGKILIGLGLLFLGIDYMKDGFTAIKETIDLASFTLTGTKGLIVFIILGALATVIIQSSGATMAIIITALAFNQITYENALALTIGANIGTTITAILGSLTSNSNGKRLALAHFIFNMQTAFFALLLLQPLVLLVDEISLLFKIRDDDYILKLALFHTLFNVLGILLILPFINKLVNLLSRSFNKEEISQIHSKFICKASYSLPEVSLIALQKESKYLYYRAKKLFAHTIHLHTETINSDLEAKQVIEENTQELYPIKIEKSYQKKIKPIYSEILFFSSQAQSYMNNDEIEIHNKLMQGNHLLIESIKDCYHLERNITSHFNSDNPTIIKHYQHIREFLLLVYRYVDNSVLHQKVDESQLYQSILDFQKEQNSLLIEHIANKTVEQNVATSLMNDISYTTKIAQKLLHFSQLFQGKNHV